MKKVRGSGNERRRKGEGKREGGMVPEEEREREWEEGRRVGEREWGEGQMGERKKERGERERERGRGRKKEGGEEGKKGGVREEEGE